MKIVTFNGIYVLRKDIEFLNKIELVVPASIYLKRYECEGLLPEDNDAYKFVKFKSSREIEYISKLDWLIDYDEVKNLTEEEIKQIGQQIGYQQNDLIEKYNAMNEEEQTKNSDMAKKIKILYYKLCMLRDIIWFKQGALDIKLPFGVEKPLSLIRVDNSEHE